MSRIGELLVREKMLSLAQLQQAQEEAKRTGKRLGATLAKLGYVKDQDLTPVVASEGSIEIALGRYFDKGPNLDEMIGEFDVDNVDFTSSGDADVNIVDL